MSIFSLIKEGSSKYTWYCDMDGVLVNFDKGYFELTGKYPHEMKNKDPQLFWEPISKVGKQFWEELEWMPDGEQLWNYIKIYNPTLLSSPSRDCCIKSNDLNL